MKTILNRKNLITSLFIIIIDAIVISSWIWYISPDPSGEIAIIVLIPTLFIVNIIIAGIIYFIKKYYTVFFIVNAFISSLMMFFFFGWYIEIGLKKYYESWEFSINNKNYDISYPQSIDTTYYITYRMEPDWSSGEKNDRGTVQVRNDTVYFFAVDSSKYYIHNYYLYNFKNMAKIKVKKKY